MTAPRHTLFADTSKGFLTGDNVWRTSRPVLVLVAAIAIAALAHNRGAFRLVLLVCVLVPAILTLTALALRIGLVRSPRRAVLVFEIEVLARVALVTVGLAVVVYLMGELTEQYQSKVPAYFVGLLAGAAVGFFSKEIFKQTENESWFELHFRHRINALYEPYFYRMSPEMDRWEHGGQRRWMPDGMMSDALSAIQYRNEHGTDVNGWGRKARRTRADTIRSGLHRDPDPVPIVRLPGRTIDSSVVEAGRDHGTGSEPHPGDSGRQR